MYNVKTLHIQLIYYLVTLFKEAAIVQQNFLRDNAFNMKAGMLFIESSLAPCFIQMLQLIIKGSLILENSIIVLIAQARQIVDHLNHLPYVANP